MVSGITTEISELIALKHNINQYYHRIAGANTLGGSRYLSKLRGRGMDFAEVRNYQTGDEIRHMEWRITARTGRPHIKVYHEERDRSIVIVNDFNPSMYFGTRVAFKSVLAARLAALIAWMVVRQGDKVGGVLTSATKHNEFMPKSRAHGILPWLAQLSAYTKALPSSGRQTQRQLSETLHKLRYIAHPGSILILISDFYELDDDSECYLRKLSAHNDILVYHVFDPLELALPKPNAYAIANGLDTAVLDLTQPANCLSYTKFCNMHTQKTSLLCAKLQIQYTQVTHQNNLAELVYQTFLRRMHV